MAFSMDDYGNMTLVQGDTVSLAISGLDTTQNYTVYFAIQDSDRNPIGTEISVSANYSDSVVFEITSELTDLLEVDADEESAEYTYGIKVCNDDGFEDTLLVGNSELGDVNTITVYPKKVEGV